MLGWLKRKESRPPNAAQVAGRARILSARIVHTMAWPPPAALSNLMASWSDAERVDISDKYTAASQAIRASLESTGLWAQTTPDEREFFSARLSERTQQQCVDASWSVESVACCLWALSVLNVLPDYDTESHTDICKQVPQAGESLSLRPAAELERARAVAESWHWRSRTRGLMESGEPIPTLPNDLTLDQVVRLTARAAAKTGDFAEPCDEDFPAFGKPYRDLSPNEYATATSIAMERHKALNWICGFAPNNQWDRTPTTT